MISDLLCYLFQVDGSRLGKSRALVVEILQRLCALRPATITGSRIGFVTYLVPYFPVTPTFLVLFVILAVVAVMNGVWR